MSSWTSKTFSRSRARFSGKNRMGQQDGASRAQRAALWCICRFAQSGSPSLGRALRPSSRHASCYAIARARDCFWPLPNQNGWYFTTFVYILDWIFPSQNFLLISMDVVDVARYVVKTASKTTSTERLHPGCEFPARFLSIYHDIHSHLWRCREFWLDRLRSVPSERPFSNQKVPPCRTWPTASMVAEAPCCA